MTKHSTSMNPLAFIRKYDELFNRLLFLLGALVVYRFGSHVPIPGMDPESLSKFFQTNENTILGLFNMFSGGALERMSVMALGIMPYISASIIVQMMTAVKKRRPSRSTPNQQVYTPINPCLSFGSINWYVYRFD